jgi:hypothetical protein
VHINQSDTLTQSAVSTIFGEGYVFPCNVENSTAGVNGSLYEDLAGRDAGFDEDAEDWVAMSPDVHDIVTEASSAEVCLCMCVCMYV